MLALFDIYFAQTDGNNNKGKYNDIIILTIMYNQQ